MNCTGSRPHSRMTHHISCMKGPEVVSLTNIIPFSTVSTYFCIGLSSYCASCSHRVLCDVIEHFDVDVVVG